VEVPSEFKVSADPLFIEKVHDVVGLYMNPPEQVPADLGVHVVADNYASHTTPAVEKWLDAHPRFPCTSPPTSSSWQLIERWFAELTAKMLRRGAHRSVQALEKDIRDCYELQARDTRSLLPEQQPCRELELAGHIGRRRAAGHPGH